MLQEINIQEAHTIANLFVLIKLDFKEGLLSSLTTIPCHSLKTNGLDYAHAQILCHHQPMINPQNMWPRPPDHQDSSRSVHGASSKGVA